MNQIQLSTICISHFIDIYVLETNMVVSFTCIQYMEYILLAFMEDVCRYMWHI